MKKVNDIKHVLYFMLLLLIFTNINSTPLEKVVQKKLAVSQADRKDRKCNTQPYFLSFICGSSLPIYLTPKLVQLYTDVSIVDRALKEVNFSWSSAK